MSVTKFSGDKVWAHLGQRTPNLVLVRARVDTTKKVKCSFGQETSVLPPGVCETQAEERAF